MFNRGWWLGFCVGVIIVIFLDIAFFDNFWIKLFVGWAVIYACALAGFFIAKKYDAKTNKALPK